MKAALEGAEAIFEDGCSQYNMVPRPVPGDKTATTRPPDVKDESHLPPKTPNGRIENPCNFERNGWHYYSETPIIGAGYSATGSSTNKSSSSAGNAGHSVPTNYIDNEKCSYDYRPPSSSSFAPTASSSATPTSSSSSVNAPQEGKRCLYNGVIYYIRNGNVYSLDGRNVPAETRNAVLRQCGIIS
jgi:hypothetical protein